jgi:hypothetical protein
MIEDNISACLSQNVMINKNQEDVFSSKNKSFSDFASFSFNKNSQFATTERMSYFSAPEIDKDVEFSQDFTGLITNNDRNKSNRYYFDVNIYEQTKDGKMGVVMEEE